MIKSMLGKIDIPDGIHERIIAEGLIEMPLTADHAMAVGDFSELSRPDPFDRLLVAQAYRAGHDVLTADHGLLGLGRGSIVDARA